MSWLKHHSNSEEFASQAEALLKKGDVDDALILYWRAAESEALAIEDLDHSKKRTLGITVVSAASLWFKAKELRQAERIACKWLASDSFPNFAIEELQSILQTVWNEKVFQEAGIEFAKGEVLVSVSGGEVVTGGAPLDLIHLKVTEVRNLFFRTIEMLLNHPFRRRGTPSPFIQQHFRPWILQAPPGSYQFAVRVQKPAQLLLFPDATPEVEEVTNRFLEIVDAASQETHEKLEETVPDPEYRDAFLKLSRNLAPTGKSFKKLEIKSATDLVAQPIVFSPSSRKAINKTLRKSRKDKSDQKKDLKEEQLVGVLRGLHLDKDWLEISISEDETVRVYQTGDVIDDVVGPMVNHRVVVAVSIRPDDRHLFRDIELED